MELFDGQSQGVSIRECARQLGVSDTAIRKAIDAGRCSRLANGMVDVEAVRLGMSSTANPFRGGQRKAGVVGTLPLQTVVSAAGVPMPAAQAVQAPAPAAQAPAPSPAAAKSTATGLEKQTALLDARLSTEQTRAERESIELAMLKGTVVEAAPVLRGVVDAMVAARSEILSLPDRLTPIVTPETDAGKVYAAIESEVQRVCQALQDKLNRLAQPPESAA